MHVILKKKFQNTESTKKEEVENNKKMLMEHR